MESKRLWTTIVTALVLFAVGPRSPGVRAQGPSCLPGRQWNENSLGQNPCAVANVLEISCRDDATYTIRSLDGPSDYYSAPHTSNNLDLKCDCNTVMYSLYEACTTCQNGIVLSWTRWFSGICTVVYVAQFPFAIPLGTVIPRWAFIDVTTLPNETYSDAVAMSVGRDPESTSNSSSTVLSVGSSTFSSMPPSSSAPSPTNGGGNSTDDLKSHLGVIVGSAVGGGTALIILTAVITFIIVRRRLTSVDLPQPLIRETESYYPASPTTISANIPHPVDPNTYELEPLM